MCTDHPLRRPVSRRTVLAGGVAAATLPALSRAAPVPLRHAWGRRLPLTSPLRAVTPADGASAYSMAMHIHSSFSEQTGSMDSQLFQATLNAVDVLWWTDHDARLDGLNFRSQQDFLNPDAPPAGQGLPWVWGPHKSGPLTTASTATFVTSPVTPNDPGTCGSLAVAAQSTAKGGTAKYGLWANCQKANWNYRGNLTGQTLSIDILLQPGWTSGYLELLINTSFHQASAGRPAGQYALSYRFGPATRQPSTVTQGNSGVINIPVQPAAPGEWFTATVSPSADIATLWPDLDYRDFALWELFLSAASSGTELVSGYFGYLRFDRSVSGQPYLDQQASMMAALEATYPDVTQQQGLEVSPGGLPHVNWFGPGITVPDWGAVSGGYAPYIAGTVIPAAHAAGGLVSYNHPFGTSFGPAFKAPATQDALLTSTAFALLPTSSAPACLGADLLEVGYPNREGVDLAHHLALWDVMSRNGVFLTGTGTSDDHLGQDWAGILNNWVTWAWAPSTGLTDLLAAMAAGRSWCGALGAFTGTLDLLVDGVCPMGSVSVSSLSSRQLTVLATGLPAGSTVQVLQGAVDYAGTGQPAANTALVSTLPAAAGLATGSATVTLDTAGASFARCQVLSATGTVVAVSNPVWMLTAAPAGGIPAARGT